MSRADPGGLVFPGDFFVIVMMFLPRVVSREAWGRLVLYSLQQGDDVRLFVSGKGVEIDQINDPEFDVIGQAQKVLEAGGKFLACGVCLKLHHAEGSEICPLSTLKDQYEIVRDSDKVIMV